MRKIIRWLIRRCNPKSLLAHFSGQSSAGHLLPVCSSFPMTDEFGALQDVDQRRVELGKDGDAILNHTLAEIEIGTAWQLGEIERRRWRGAL